MSSSSNKPKPGGGGGASTPPPPLSAAAAATALSDASGSGKKSKNNSPTTTSTTTGAAASNTNSNIRPSPPEAKRQRTTTAATPPPTAAATATSNSLFSDAATTRSAAAAAAAAAKKNNNNNIKTATATASSSSYSPTLRPDFAAAATTAASSSASLLDATASASNLSLLHQVTHLSWIFTRNNSSDCGGGGGQWHAEGTTSLYIIDNSAATARVAAAAAAAKQGSSNNNSSSSDNNKSSSPLASQLQLQQQQQAAAAAARAAAVAANEASTTTLALHLKGSCQVLQVQVEALNKRAVLTPLPSCNNNSTNTNSTSTNNNNAAFFVHADPLQHVLIKSPSSYCIQDFIMLNNNNNNNNNTTSNAKDDEDNDNNNNNMNRRPYRFDADAQSSRGAMGMTKGLRAASIASLKGELLIVCPRAEVLVGAANVVSTKPTTTTTTATPAANTVDGSSATSTTTTTTTTTPTSPAQEAAMKAWQKALTATSSSSSLLSSSAAKSTTTSPRKSSLNNNATTTSTTGPSFSPTTATALDGDNDSSSSSSSASSLFGIGMLELQSRLYNRSQTRRPKRIQLISRRLAAASASPIRNTAFRVTIHWRIPLPTSNSTISRHHLGGLHVLTGMDDDLPGLGGGGGRSGDSTVAATNPTATTTTPHVYTTAGVLGDHQGPRSWLPCLDACSTNFRSSHELYVKLTAPVREGLSICGMGEDVGVWESYLHENINTSTSLASEQSSPSPPPPTSLLVHQEQQQALLGNTNTMMTAAAATTNGVDETSRILGANHVAHVQRIQCNNNIESLETRSASSGMNQQQQQQQQNQQQPHVIPPDQNNLPTTTTTLSLNDIQATCLWCSATWTPIPARSLGFAIGPFKALEDPEYFGPTGPVGAAAAAQADDEDGDSGMERRLLEFCHAARQNGEGIRQVYFAPLMERKYLHLTGNSIFTNTNRRLLPNTRILLQPLSVHQRKVIHDLNQTVTFATVGVAHRALSLMRDVLALPRYRTNSYIQIWIPHAVDGGTTSGALRSCPECLVNPFLGGAILDARLLPPIASRLPYYQGGRVLQFLQARNAIRGWILAALPLGGNDDVGNGYIHTLVESFIMSLYERGHGAHGEGGARGGVFFSRRYSPTSGLNSSNLDFLPVRNIEEMSSVAGGLGAVPVEDRHNDQLWRSATNGSESHTSAMDEYSTRQLLCKDVLEALERGNDRDKHVPTPSMGWHGAGFLFGSHLSLTFLSSNASSSSDLGCGALELFHPIGGLVYRTLKTEIFRGVVEGRAGVANLLRLMRASFVAAHLGDQGETELVLPVRRNRKSAKDDQLPDKQEDVLPKPPFVVCVNEILAKKGLTHTLFTRALQNICGKLREGLLLGTLVDVERNAEDPRTRRPFVEPEGFPNSYVRGASLLYCRVGVQVEQSREANSVGKVQAQIYAEPIIPEGGIAYGGPVTVRVVENEGQFREYMKDLSVDGSRRDWGAMVLHAKPVTTPKAQAAASGTVESSESTKKSPSKQGARGGHGGGGVFADSHFHSAGFQAIELIRLTNLTPLLWVRVDPAGLYGGRISVVQPDACLAEQLFHDGDAAAQVDALRQLAERPLRIQGSVKVTSVHDVAISDLPVRVLGDCLRGSPALHSSLPHTPAVRRLAALAIAQWQNNKAPQSKDAVGTDSWLGIDLLIQYFRERFYSSSVVMPMKFTRLAVRKSEAEARAASAANEGGAGNPKPSHDDSFQYLDALDEGDERAAALEDASDVETEEDEEYRVRAAVVTAVASIRAKDGQTPSTAIRFLETVLEAEDDNMMGNVVFPDDDMMVEKTFRKLKSGGDETGNADSDGDDDELPTPSLSYISSQLVADTLLALCHVNASPTVYTDPSTGKSIHSAGRHPVAKLMELAKGWLDWELYRETIRAEVNLATRTGIAGNCHDVIAACAIVSLSNLAILRQSTTHSIPEHNKSKSSDPLDELTTAKYYMDIFDSKPQRNDHTRAAAAQAVACICCAADRFEVESIPSLGLLTALEFLLDRIIEEQTSPSLRQTLAMIMMDACTGKVCSMQRVGSIAGRNDLITSAARFFCGPLLASHGGDCGGALLMSVTPASFPAASSVNDGARRGMRVLNRAGHPRDTNMSRPLVVRVARFATRLWRTINGEPADALTVPIGISKDASPTVVTGVCSYDGALRCSLLSLWLILWPKGCFAVLQVQAWKTREGTTEYKEMGAQHVMKITDSEMQAAKEEDASLNDLAGLVNSEIDRQEWRGEMAQKAYSLFKSQGNNPTTVVDAAAAEQGIGQPLPPIQRDMAFKHGGWIASAAQQRRAKALDGGTAVTKLRLKVGGNK